MIIDTEYNIREDIKFILESEDTAESDFASKINISRTTLFDVINKNKASNDILEKIYSYVFSNNYRLNSVKEEIAKERYNNILFHGSKFGLSNISINDSRDNCDFGKGFYLGETYKQALSFVCEKDGSCVYSFKYSLDNLKVKKFECDLEWMLAICHYRGTLKNVIYNDKINKIISEVENADVIIAPIADNKMFYIMAQFIDGEINADVALHSLSASKLGHQYIFKTEKSLNNLKVLEKYYLSKPERDDCTKYLNERGFLIDTKLKLAKREFRNGLYIEEILK